MIRTSLRRRTRLRPVGAKAKRLRAGWEASKKVVLARAGGRCENPWCRRATRLDVHHIVKRSHGRDDSPLNLVALCRPCHALTDLPKATSWGPTSRRLTVRTFVDDFRKTFALFAQWSDVSPPVALDPPAKGIS